MERKKNPKKSSNMEIPITVDPPVDLGTPDGEGEEETTARFDKSGNAVKKHAKDEPKPENGVFAPTVRRRGTDPMISGAAGKKPEGRRESTSPMMPAARRTPTNPMVPARRTTSNPTLPAPKIPTDPMLQVRPVAKSTPPATAVPGETVKVIPNSGAKNKVRESKESAAKNTCELAVTLGPASFGKEVELIRAGATRLRLNASHMTVDDLTKAVERIRHLSSSIRLVIDLQGTKMRLGAIKTRNVSEGDEISFARSIDISPTAVHLPHDGFFDAITPGDTFSIGDGDMVFMVIRKKGLTAVARAMTSGALLPKKGVTILGKSVSTEKNVNSSNQEKIQSVVEAIGGRSVSWALSYVSGAEELADLRRHLPKNAKLIAKIERQSAIDNLDDIAAAADALWICRGDLGEQVGLANMARFVGQFDPRRYPIPTVMAGQVFHHMVDHDTPTRAEVCQLFNLLNAGYRGVVLSDETAVGENPVATVKLVRQLMDEMW